MSTKAFSPQACPKIGGLRLARVTQDHTELVCDACRFETFRRTHCWVPVEVFPALMGARKCESMVVCDVVLDALCWVVVELM